MEDRWFLLSAEWRAGLGGALPASLARLGFCAGFPSRAGCQAGDRQLQIIAAQPWGPGAFQNWSTASLSPGNLYLAQLGPVRLSLGGIKS